MGPGNIAEAHLRAFDTHGVHVAAVCGRTPDRTKLRLVELGLNARVCESAEELVADGEVDLVSICSPPECHTAQTILAAKSGKPIIVEKPIALSLEELKQGAAAVKESGVHTGVSFPWRYLPGYVNGHSRLSAIGEARILHAEIWNGEWHRRRRLKFLNSGQPHMGEMLRSAVHAVDILCRFAKCKVTRVSAVSPRNGQGSSTAVTLLFESGAIGTLLSSAECFRPLALNLVASGKKGWLHCDMDYDRVLLYHQEGPRTFQNLGPVPAQMASSAKELPFSPMIGDFIESMRQGKDTAVPYAYAVHIHEVCFAAEDSAAQEGEWISLAA